MLNPPISVSDIRLHMSRLGGTLNRMSSYGRVGRSSASNLIAVERLLAGHKYQEVLVADLCAIIAGTHSNSVSRSPVGIASTAWDALCPY